MCLADSRLNKCSSFSMMNTSRLKDVNFKQSAFKYFFFLFLLFDLIT